MKQYSKGELALLLLKVLLTAGVVVTVIALPGIAPVLNLFQPKNTKDRQRIKQSLYRMENRGFIKINRKNNRKILVTQKGRKYFQKHILNSLVIKKPSRWDGRWRVILFDIPEHKRNARNSLSRKLKELGLYRFQKSAFVFPYECKKEIDFIINHFGIQKYVQYLVVQKIDSEKKLKKHFVLKY